MLERPTSTFNTLNSVRERINLAYELDTVLDGQIWKSPDIKTSHDLKLRPYSTQEIDLSFSPDALLPVITPNLIPLLKTSVRSRYAQIGLDIPLPPSEVTSDFNSDLLKGKIFISNLGPRTIKIDTNTPIFRFFGIPAFDNLALQGLSFNQAILSSKIVLSGQEGKDWRYHYDESGILTGIELILDPNKSKSIKETFLNPPIYIPDIPDNVQSGRQFIDRNYLTNKKPNSYFRIEETSSKLSINDSNINGIVSVRCFNNNQKLSGIIHSSSVLIDAGFDNFVRAEITDLDQKNQSGTSILIQFYQNKK